MTVLHEDEFMRVELTDRKSVKTTLKCDGNEGPSSETFVRVAKSIKEIHVTAGDSDTKVEPHSFEDKPAIRLTHPKA